MRKLLRVLLTFSNPLRAILDRLGFLEGETIRHRLRNGLTFTTRPGSQDIQVLYDIFAAREYQPAEPPELELRPGWTVLDLGANIGAFSLQAALAGCHVQAYEPLPENCGFLAENVGRNSVPGSIQWHPVAVADVPGTMHLYPQGPSSSAHWNRQDIGIPVETVAIADILARHKHVDFLKCDIEGGEFALFSVLNGTHFEKIDRIAMEYHDFQSFDHRAIVAHLRRHGYEVWVRPKDSLYGLIFAERRYL
jgi:FkbM family methyltransferase